MAEYLLWDDQMKGGNRTGTLYMMRAVMLIL
jgi:hypothetical protein